MTNKDNIEIIYITTDYFTNNKNVLDKNKDDDSKKYVYSLAYNVNNKNNNNIKEVIEIAYYDNLHNAYNQLYTLYKILPEFFYVDYHIITYLIKDNIYQDINKIYRLRRNTEIFV